MRRFPKDGTRQQKEAWFKYMLDFISGKGKAKVKQRKIHEFFKIREPIETFEAREMLDLWSQLENTVSNHRTTVLSSQILADGPSYLEIPPWREESWAEYLAINTS